MGNVMELPRGGIREPVPEPPAASCASAAPSASAASCTPAASCAPADGDPPGRRPLCRFFRR